MIGSKKCTTGKAKNTVKRYTQSSDTPIGDIAMFVQIGKRYTPFLAFHQFTQITNNLGSSDSQTFLY
jgi:hypothetical protein